VLGMANLVSNWPPICVGLPGLRLREAGVSNTASAALSNTVPEGGAVATGLTFAMQRSWGFRLEAITLGFTATGLWTNVIRYGLLALALVAWAVQERSTRLAVLAAALVAVMVVVLVILGLIMRRESFARSFGRFAGHVIHPYFRFTHKAPPDFAELVATFRRDLVGLLRTRWLALTVSMTVSQVMTALVLVVMLRLQGVGADVVGPAQVYVAYASAALVALVIPVPGGIGVVEATLLAILGLDQTAEVQSQILSAIVAYRFATWLLPIPIGAGTYLFWRYNKAWRHTEAEKQAQLPITAASVALGT
jgi:putative heme transporter